MALPQTDPLTNLIVLKWDPPREGDPEKASNSLVLGKGKIKKKSKNLCCFVTALFEYHVFASP